MATMEDRTTNWLVKMVLSGIVLTPLLALAKAIAPLPLPWLGVFIPWIGVFHLLLSWFAAKIIARVFWDLLHWSL